MTRKLFNDAGDEVEVPDEKELEALNESAKKVEEIKKEVDAIREKVGAKEGEDINKVLDRIKEDANPNFTAMRKKLSDKTKELDDATKVLEENKIEFGKEKPSLSVEEITKNATEAGTKAATQTLIENELGKLLAKYDDEQKLVVRKFFDKLVSGEEVNLENLGEFVDQSVKASGVVIEPSGRDYADGGAPNFKKEGEDFAETEDGKKIGQSIFGEDFGKTKEEREETKK